MYIIDNEEARMKIETRSVLLFYSEDYDSYKSRIEERLFGNTFVRANNYF